jgi:hypothetical protein
MASGLSTGLIARMLDANGGQTLATLDQDNTFSAIRHNQMGSSSKIFTGVTPSQYQSILFARH